MPTEELDKLFAKLSLANRANPSDQATKQMVDECEQAIQTVQEFNRKCRVAMAEAESKTVSDAISLKEKVG